MYFPNHATVFKVLNDCVFFDFVPCKFEVLALEALNYSHIKWLHTRCGIHWKEYHFDIEKCGAVLIIPRMARNIIKQKKTVVVLPFQSSVE